MSAVEEISSLLLAEERRRYSMLRDVSQGMRNRTLAILTIEFAILTYFFSDVRSVVPSEIYGIIFFAISAFCLAVSVGILFYCYRSVDWPDPVGPIEIEKINNTISEQDAVNIIIDDYRAAANDANKILKRRGKLLNVSLYLFIMSVIILLVIKFFNLQLT